mgnify:CR=1 FL=1
MIKAKIKVPLNKRGAPSVNASKDKHYVAGQEVNIVDLINGDMVDGIDVWYKLDNGSYVWSGGVEGMISLKDLGAQLLETNDSSTEDSESPDLSKKIVLNTEIPQGEGQDIRIAVLDSGIDKRHESLKNRIIWNKNYQSDKNLFYHGSLTAGILVANDSELIGMCGQADLLDLRVADDDGIVEGDAVKQALEDIVVWNNDEGKPFISVVNLSLDVTKALIILIQPVVTTLYEQGVVIIVAGNVRNRLTNIASLEFVISVGVFRNKYFEEICLNGIDPKLVLMYLNEEIISTSLFPNHEGFKDSSAYTAVTSGLVARFLSSIETKNPYKDAIKFLKKCAFPIQQESKPITFKLYRNENP